jgi:hypothetical protein
MFWEFLPCYARIFSRLLFMLLYPIVDIVVRGIGKHHAHALALSVWYKGHAPHS